MIIKTSKLYRFWRKSTRAWWWSLLATSSPVCPLCPCRQSQPMDRSQLAVFTTWSPGSSLSEEVISITKFNLRALGPAIGGSIGIMFTVSVFARTIFFFSWVLSLPWKGGEHCLRWNVHNWFCYLCQWSHAGDSLEMSKQRKQNCFASKLSFLGRDSWLQWNCGQGMSPSWL